MSYPRLDVKSNLTALCNAQAENDTRINILRVELQEAEEYQRHLLVIIDQRFRAVFSESHAPDLDGKAILRKIEANVKRSASRVVADKKRQNRAESDARTAAMDKARIVIDKYHMNELTASMIQYINDAVAKVYGKKTHLRSPR